MKRSVVFPFGFPSVFSESVCHTNGGGASADDLNDLPNESDQEGDAGVSDAEADSAEEGSSDYEASDN